MNVSDAGKGIIVVALGGNAIARFDDDGAIATQYRRAEEAMVAVADIALSNRHLVLTHGNGPVVGNIVMRGELANSTIPATPLFIADADSQGGIGLMLQQVLGNELRHRGSDLVPVTLVTQVIVDPLDAAFANPTKPIGPYYATEQMAKVTRERDWMLAEEPGRGWRRVVPSPRPLRVVEVPAVKALLSKGMIPIAAGGGGVPVIETSNGVLTGVDAVIDKDWTAAVMANELGAELLIVLMEADALYDDFGTPDARRVSHLDAHAASALADRLPQGSVGPKVAAAAWLAQRGVRTVLCSATEVTAALSGDAGTTISPA